MVKSVKTTVKISPLLSGKLNPPNFRHVMARPRLLEKVTAAGNPGFVKICAGAGFGKTTLMTQLTEHLGGKSVWYQVDNLDSDPVVFLKNLITGVSSACDNVGSRAIARLEDSEDINKEGHSILGVLLDELNENLKSRLTICIDDYYMFDGADFAKDFFSYLIRNMPSQAMVIIASRTKPDLEMQDLKVGGLICEIGEEDLKFSLAELQGLLNDTWNMNVSQNTLLKLHKNTEGWAAGLVLLEEHLKNSGDIPELFEEKQIRKNIYEFLAEEVLSKQTEDLQELLVKTSVVEMIDPSICDQALEVKNSARMLAKAEKKNLFTTRVGGDGLFRYHPLFREFLRSRLTDNYKSEEIKTIHLNFGKSYEGAGDKEQAIEHFIAAGAREDTIRLVMEVGEGMLKEGEYVTLSRWLDELKGPDNPPVLDVYRGKVLLAGGMITEAVSVLRSAQAVIGEKDVNLLCDCGVAIAEGMGLHGKFNEVIKVLRPLVRLPVDTSLKMKVLYRLALAHWNILDDHGINSCVKQAKELAHNGRELYLINCVEGVQSLSSGDFYRASIVLKEALKDIDITSSNRILITNNLAASLMLLGEYDEAEYFIEKVYEEIDNQRYDIWLPLVLDTMGNLQIAKGQEKKGKVFLNKAVEAAKSFDFTKQELSDAYCHLGTMDRRKGAYSNALKYHNESISICQRIRHIHNFAKNNISAGADLVRLGRLKEAEKYFNEADELATKHNFGFVKTMIDFQSAWRAHLIEDKETEIKSLSSALKRANKYQHNHFIIQEGKISLPLFSTALLNDIETDYVFWVLERIGQLALSAIEPVLDSDEPELRNKAVTAIGKIGGNNALALLRRTLHDKDKHVRENTRTAVSEVRSTLKALDNILTNREMDVLKALASGLSNAKIARKIFISERTVKVHVGSIFRKLGFSNRLEAALFYHKYKNEENPTFFE